MNVWGDIVVAALGLLGGGSLTGLLLVKRQARKVSADAQVSEATAAEVLSKTAASLVEPLSRQLKEAEGRAHNLNVQLTQTQGELTMAQSEVQQLRSQVQQLTADVTRLTEENERLRTGG